MAIHRFSLRTETWPDWFVQFLATLITAAIVVSGAWRLDTIMVPIV
ncbi:MAG: hypothetical protein MI924_27980 [Chloroflexales bacterium]|nr:hypothetical protein [Chloroflexales bacterium]